LERRIHVEVGLGNWGFTTGEKGDLTNIKTKKTGDDV
jgi:hypothetical protein